MSFPVHVSSVSSHLSACQRRMKSCKGPKLLALHSFRTSAAIFEKQLKISGLYRLLTEDLGAELTFVNAPHKASGPIPQDVQMAFPSQDDGENGYYEWWNATFDEEHNTWHYENCDASLEFLKGIWKEHGGFDGIIGFSQGAAITALLSAMLVIEKNEMSQEIGSVDDGKWLKPPKCIVCISGIKVRDARFVPYYQAISHLPSVHIFGQHDPVKILTNKLVKCFASPVVLTHERGHVVPRLHADMSATLKNFIRSSMCPQDGQRSSKF